MVWEKVKRRNVEKYKKEKYDFVVIVSLIFLSSTILMTGYMFFQKTSSSIDISKISYSLLIMYFAGLLGYFISRYIRQYK